MDRGGGGTGREGAGSGGEGEGSGERGGGKRGERGGKGGERGREEGRVRGREARREGEGSGDRGGGRRGERGREAGIGYPPVHPHILRKSIIFSAVISGKHVHAMYSPSYTPLFYSKNWGMQRFTYFSYFCSKT